MANGSAARRRPAIAVEVRPAPTDEASRAALARVLRLLAEAWRRRAAGGGTAEGR